MVCVYIPSKILVFHGFSLSNPEVFKGADAFHRVFLTFTKHPFGGSDLDLIVILFVV